MIDTDHNQNSGDTSDRFEGPEFVAAKEKLRQLEAQTQSEMPRYRCHKKVHALKIDAIHLDVDLAKSEGRETDGGAFVYPEDKAYAPFKVDAAYVQKHNPQPGGYFVVYDDGYKSFSPAKAFDSGYTRII